MATAATPRNEKAQRERAVVTKAVLRAAAGLEFTDLELARILGILKTSVAHMRQGSRLLKQEKKEWELAILFLRFYRSVVDLAGPNPTNVRLWLNAENDHLGQIPRQQIAKAEGLVRAVHYLEIMHSGVYPAA